MMVFLLVGPYRSINFPDVSEKVAATTFLVSEFCSGGYWSDWGKKMLVCCSHKSGCKDFVHQTHSKPQVFYPWNSPTSLSVASTSTRIELIVPEDGSSKFLRNFRRNVILCIIWTHEITPWDIDSTVQWGVKYRTASCYACHRAVRVCDCRLLRINPLNTKRREFYLKTQFVPRCKHFLSRL